MKQTLTLLLILLCISSFAHSSFLDKYKTPHNNTANQLLIFYKPDCPYCINMETALNNDAILQQAITKKFNVQLVDITSKEGRMIADKFDVHAVPTIINYNTNTGDIQYIKGFTSAGKFAQKLGIAYDHANTINEIPSATCGNGKIEAGETCDDGNIVNGDGCDNNCTFTSCGNGVIAGTEQCDDGNLSNGDGCDNNCQIEFNDECSNAILLTSVGGIITGDNTSATTSFNPLPSCQASIAHDVWYKFTLAAPKQIHIELNGPGITDAVLVIYSGTCGSLAEVGCSDDIGGGNLYSLVETILPAGNYYIRAANYASSSPGTYTLAYNLNGTNVCGNGVLESGEECDDGNTSNGDGCSNICKTENAASIKGVSISTDGLRADPSAMLDVKSFDRGILIPRMPSSKRLAIPSPAKGLMVFDITTNTFWYYTGIDWNQIGGTSGVAGGGLPIPSAAFQTLGTNGGVWIPNNTLQNDGNTVTVNGTLKVTGGNPGTDKVLISDADGLASWAGSSAFYVTAATQTFSSTFIPAAANFSEVYDDENAVTNGIFTAPVTGLYQLSAQGNFAFNGTLSTQASITILIEKSGGFNYASATAIIPIGFTNEYSLPANTVVKLTAGDVVSVRFFVTGPSGSGSISPAQTLKSFTFKGARIH